MKCRFFTESERRDSFNQSLSKYFGQNVFPFVYGNRAGDSSTKSTFRDVFIAVVKNEMGSGGCCPYLQHALYYGQTLLIDGQFTQRSRFPAFGAYLSGSYLGITGLVFYDKRVFCEPLTDCIPLFISPHCRPQWEKVARMLKSLKCGVVQLIEEDRQLLNKPVGFGVTWKFPYLTAIRGIPVQFLHRLRSDKLLFVVSLQNAAGAYVLKFTRTYSEESHKKCAELGVAPTLHCCEPIAGGWNVVLMDLIEDACTADQVTDTADRQTITDMMHRFLTQFHEAGFVHGDFRPNNILVRRNAAAGGEWEMFVVDFDHCGHLTQVVYPSFLNTQEIRWAEGATTGALVKPEHDFHFVDLYASQQ